MMDSTSLMHIITIKKIARHALLTALTATFTLLSGCASGPKRNPTDPLEPMNRAVSSFNDGLDRAVLKPVATAYREVTPQPVRKGVSNFFDNLEDLWSSFNGVLQLRPQVAVDDFMRFSINTFLGLGGLLDVAGELGIERHSEDFGKTLGRWGVPSGPYVVLPLFGPSTLRDALSFGIESQADTVRQINHVQTRNSLYALRVVDTRSGLLRLGNMLDEAALDKYSFTRDAFLQKRRAEIYRPGNEGSVEKPSYEDKDKDEDKAEPKPSDTLQDVSKP
jgi:phospholipid-binding lipoprotein MlaA